jgi:hypothetical protein
VDTHFAGFFTIRLDLDGTIASPEAMIFELFELGMMLVKSLHRCFKKILKEEGFEFFSGLAEGRFGAGLSLFEKIVEFSLQTFFKSLDKNLHKNTKDNFRFRVKSVGFWRYLSKFFCASLRKSWSSPTIFLKFVT